MDVSAQNPEPQDQGASAAGWAELEKLLAVAEETFGLLPEPEAEPEAEQDTATKPESEATETEPGRDEPKVKLAPLPVLTPDAAAAPEPPRAEPGPKSVGLGPFRPRPEPEADSDAETAPWPGDDLDTAAQRLGDAESWAEPDEVDPPDAEVTGTPPELTDARDDMTRTAPEVVNDDPRNGPDADALRRWAKAREIFDRLAKERGEAQKAPPRPPAQQVSDRVGAYSPRAQPKVTLGLRPEEERASLPVTAPAEDDQDMAANGAQQAPEPASTPSDRVSRAIAVLDSGETPGELERALAPPLTPSQSAATVADRLGPDLRAVVLDMLGKHPSLAEKLDAGASAAPKDGAAPSETAPKRS